MHPLMHISFGNQIFENSRQFSRMKWMNLNPIAIRKFFQNDVARMFDIMNVFLVYYLIAIHKMKVNCEKNSIRSC